MTKVSVVIPIAKFGFFVNACLQNFVDTSGVPIEEVDFVFLTDQHIPDHLQKAFNEAKTRFKFRISSAPFNAIDENHLSLLDWAIVNDPELEDWIVIQHCDMLWLSSNWLFNAIKLMDSKTITLALPLAYTCKSSMFVYNEINVTPMHDFAGFYNRKLIAESKLVFRWGIIDKLPLSTKTIKAIENQSLKRLVPNRSASNPKKVELEASIDWLDGSQALSLEMAVNFPSQIKHIRNMEIVHLWGFFRFQRDVKKEKKSLIGNFVSTDAYKLLSMFKYSWMSSFLFNEEDRNAFMEIPWRLFDAAEANVSDCKHWVKYLRPNTHVLGYGITEKISFLQLKDITLIFDGKKFIQSKLIL